MLIIPAIDIKNGKCVMLTKGEGNATIYSDDPVATAISFASAGVKRLHLVDLDAAFNVHSNLRTIMKIRESINIPIEVGGGIRNIERVDNLLNAGFDYVIIGTLAVRNPEVFKSIVSKYSCRIIAACDVYDGKIAINGWREKTNITAMDFLKALKDIGVLEVIVTDISRDGMLSGIDIKFFEKLLSIDGLEIIVSGGVKDINDIIALKNMKNKNIKGVIVGKAIYEGKLDLKEVLKLVD